MDTKVEKDVTKYLDSVNEEAEKEGEKTAREYREYTEEYERGFRDRVHSHYSVEER